LEAQEVSLLPEKGNMAEKQGEGKVEEVFDSLRVRALEKNEAKESHHPDLRF
jgi:hypothetical protein